MGKSWRKKSIHNNRLDYGPVLAVMFQYAGDLSVFQSLGVTRRHPLNKLRNSSNGRKIVWHEME